MCVRLQLCNLGAWLGLDCSVCGSEVCLAVAIATLREAWPSVQWMRLKDLTWCLHLELSRGMDLNVLDAAEERALMLYCPEVFVYRVCKHTAHLKSRQ